MFELKLRAIDRSPVDRASQRLRRGDERVIAVVHENSSARSAALRGDGEKTGKQTKKEKRVSYTRRLYNLPQGGGEKK